MDDKAWDKAKERQKRIAGQIAGVGRMIQERRCCLEILQQIAAVRSALDNLGVELLVDHMDAVLVHHGAAHEATHGETPQKSPEEHLAEIQAALSRFLR